MTKKIINSVGIDVGTTTSQAIFSRLELINSAAASEVPRYDFSDRSISYISPVIFTPKDQGTVDSIDGLELLNFIDEQYQKAGLSIKDVESGAIIITGEASKAKNAKDTVMELSSQLGDFVVATAGPHLESVIAGHGSGASEYSRINGSKVLNIDIGGGTSNFSVFIAGQLVDTSCLNVGGRLIELNPQGNITKIHKPAQIVVDELFPPNSNLNQNQLMQVIECMAELISMVVHGQQSSLLNKLLMTDNLKDHGQFDAVFISGGVGECYYNLSTSDNYIFGDIGPMLADKLKQNNHFKNLNVLKPDNTLRATVIGAGMHTLSLSGSTIWLSYEDLPICNIPVLQIGTYTGDNPDEITQSWQSVGRMHDLDLDQDSYAIAVPSYLPVSYKSVKICAQAITNFTKLRKNNSYPLIVLAAQDFGKALGMELQYSIDTKDLAVIDEVQVREWDYIDIGKGMFNNSVVPLTVKSLAFPS